MDVKGEATVHIKDEKRQYRGEFYLPENEIYESLKLQGKMKFEKLESKEKISIFGEFKGTVLKAPKVKVIGSAKLTKLEADKLKIVFSGNSSYDSISAKEIIICPQKENQEFRNEVVSVIEHILQVKFPEQVVQDIPDIKIGLLTGETIDVDSCDADKIICKNAIVRGKCNIGLLVHENDIKVDESVHIMRDQVMKYSS